MAWESFRRCDMSALTGAIDGIDQEVATLVRAFSQCGVIAKTRKTAPPPPRRGKAGRPRAIQGPNSLAYRGFNMFFGMFR